MDLLSTLFDVIDLRSFSNIWYWIVLASVWTVTTQSVLGVPVDMIARARHEGGHAMADVEDLCRIKVLRLCAIGQTSAALGVALVSMALSALLVLGFFYGSEFAQALVLLTLPLVLVNGLSLRAARGMYARNPGGAQLCDELSRLRVIFHAISLTAICVTALWGMWRNLYL